MVMFIRVTEEVFHWLHVVNVACQSFLHTTDALEI